VQDVADDLDVAGQGEGLAQERGLSSSPRA